MAIDCVHMNVGLNYITAMATRDSSPVSDHSGDLKQLSSDLSRNFVSKRSEMFHEYSRALKAEGNKEKIKIRRTISPIKTEIKSLTLNGHEKDDPRGVTQGSIHNFPADKKTKVYQMQPMEDPEAERRRRNAVIAWQNRARRKREIEALETQVEGLQRSNKEMEGILQHRIEELKQCHDDLRHMQAQVSELREANWALEVKTKAQQEKFALLQEHIILINSSLEEENLAKRFLSALLERLNSFLQLSFPERSVGSSLSASPSSSFLSMHSPHVTTSPLVTNSTPHITSSPPLVTSPRSSPSLRIMPSLIPVLPTSVEITPSNNENVRN